MVLYDKLVGCSVVFGAWTRASPCLLDRMQRVRLEHDGGRGIGSGA